MNTTSPAWPHSLIKTIFPNIFFVTGTNKTVYEGNELQHSRNMIIIRENNNLSLINSVKLTPAGLAQLDQLGTVKNIIRIGAFHGRDDAFYKDHYQADLWALEGMVDEHNSKIDHILKDENVLPFANSKLLSFKSAKFPEAVIHLADHNGILITCDSIKNWISADEYFSARTAELYKQLGVFGTATINDVWLQATETKKSDFDRILKQEFKHLLSAHGEPLIDSAHQLLTETVGVKY